MGNSSNKKEVQENQTDHQRFGLVKLSEKPIDPHAEQDSEETFLMHLARSIESQKIYKEWVKSMDQIEDSETKEVLFLPLKHNFEAVGLCGSGGIVKLTYDYYEFVLKTEIENRSKLKKDFLETEVWYLLYNIVRAGQKFQHLKRKIGNVHPSNILINESGQIKIISTCSLPGEQNNYDILLEAQNDTNVVVYLAPEEINNDLIQKGTYPSHVEPCLAEVFSIGLTILSSGTLEDCDAIYRKNPYEIKKQRLNALLRTFKEKYSEFLYQTVAGMLSFNPQERKKCSTIASSLVQFEAQILDLEPFTVPNQQSYRAPSQRVSQGVPGVVYSQPQTYQPQHQINMVRQPQPQPAYYNYQNKGPIYQGPPQQQVGSVYPYAQNHQFPVYQRAMY